MLKMSFFSLLDGVNKEDLQQGEVQLEQHIQDVVPHQYPYDIGMNIG